PYVISQHNPNVMYAGTYRIHKSLNNTNNVSFSPISPDLSDGLILASRYHTITAIDESPIDSNLLFAGTVDANVWVSKDGGNNWLKIDQGIPEYYITDVKSSKVNRDAIFVSISGYKDNVNIPHLHYSANLGKSWQKLSATLPNLGINHVEITYFNDDIIFVATDGGVYYSKTRGDKWKRLGNNMPVFPVYDIEIDYRLRRLVAGTHARSIMSISIDTILPDSGTIVSLIKGDTVLCAGENVKLTAIGGQKYKWMDASYAVIGYDAVLQDSPGGKATYFCEIANRLGGRDTLRISVKYVKKPNIPLQLDKDSIFVSRQYQVTHWVKDGNYVLEQHGNYLITDQAGVYSAELQIEACKFESQSIEVPGELKDEELVLYPNPAKDHIRINKSGFEEISVFSLEGKFIKDLPTGTTQLGIKNLPNGTYFFRFKIGGKTVVKKIVKAD
ncbi:MAG: T9SS type A sorting domain-containing protein, partial [Chitinophagales bacterium]|nr:T9SS type A sorting domain-containing protein [Chitinophagales bacterium]